MTFALGIHDVMPFFIVSLFWGITNPFLEITSHQTEEEFQPMNFGFKSVFSVFKRWKFLVAFGINQIGSVLYGYLLGVYP